MSMIWIKAALTRALRTVAQSAVAFIAAGATGFFDVDWKACLSVCLLSGVLSILTSISGLPEVDIAAKEDLPEWYFEDDEDDFEEDEDEEEGGADE